MEKLNLQTFRSLKQEVMEYMQKYKEAKERGEYLPSEEVEQFSSRYREIIKILSEYDLSDIDFEEWRGMVLLVDDEFPLDFSKTKANIDFSIIEYYAYKPFPNLKSCQIKNFDFEKELYIPEMFDEEYIKENSEKFLSNSIPKDVADRFYRRNLNLTDIQKNPELIDKIESKNFTYGLSRIYDYIGKEEFCKLDAEFIDVVTDDLWTEFLETNPNLRTAEEIMPVLYKMAKEKIINYSIFNLDNHFYYSQEQLGQEFRKIYPEMFLSEEAPEDVRGLYYAKILTLDEFRENLQYFEGKSIAQAFQALEESYSNKKIIELYGDDLYQLFTNYGPIIERVLNDPWAKDEIVIPNGPITKEQRKEIMRPAIATHFSDIDRIEDLSMLKMIADFVPLEDILYYNETANKIFGKYNIDDLINAGLDFKIFHSDGRGITNLEQLKKLSAVIEEKDLPFLLTLNNSQIIEKYGIDKLIELGINDLSELSETTNDLKQIKALLEKRPIDLINMGIYGDDKKKFIERYGIDNIIALDEETGGMFSYPIWEDDIYLTLFARAEDNVPKLDENKKITYEEFRNRMYEILLHATNLSGPLRTGDFPDYDFIHGKFREEHPEIFIDGDIQDSVKRAYYTGHMKADLIRQNPELIQLLQGKDLSRVFHKEIEVGESLQLAGNAARYMPIKVNMAEFLSEKIGQEEFLRLCADYGKCLDNLKLVAEGEITADSIRENIEESIYKAIKETGMIYFEELPKSFYEKYPELFLPREIDETLRNKFYEGNLSLEDIRQNPELKKLLLTKDIMVGFGISENEWSWNRKKYLGEMCKKLTKQEIMDLAVEYGKYLKDVNVDIFKEGQSIDEIKMAVQKNIEENILNRNSPYDESIPEFFKQKYPKMFLADNAPEELKKEFYNRKNGGITIRNRTDGKGFSFQMIKEHPEWREFLQGKDLSRAFPKQYEELFKRFDGNTLLKIGTRNPETIQKMVENNKEAVLENWYKSTGGKFVPHHVVMLNFPEGEIDSFLGNSKRWSGLMRIDNYNLNDDGKAAILKASYAMGVFQGDDDGFNKTMKLFTDVPQELTQEEYEKVTSMFSMEFDPFRWNGSNFDPKQKDEEMKSIFEQAYTLNDEGKYICSIDKQKNKDSVRKVREILEKAQIPRILTPVKAHQIFDSFAMEYNPDFVRFFNDNIEEILSNPEYTKDIATIQRQFKDIVRTNAGRRLTLSVAQDYIKSIVYTDIDVGNEEVAEQAKIVGYSQEDFEAIQELYNEGEVRDFSSIPRIQGNSKGYTYEMLRCDDPLALTIGTLTDCCQEIHGAGQTSMEHSVVSPDGRVFCVRDAAGRLVAQSWFWRNQYTGCFDNIEIPDRIFELYKKEHPNIGRKGLTTDVLEVYKKAAQDLMQEDARVYKELLENETITQEQYDALLLGKVTIGLGYNDIADAIQADKTIHQETDRVEVKGTDRLPHPYTDASTQYTIAEREGTVKSEYENLYVHQDDVPVFDGTNMSSTVLLKMKRMEQGTERNNIAYVSEESDNENVPKSQRIINNIAEEYGLNASDTKVMATARTAIIYSKDDNNKIKIAELLSSPLKQDLTEEQKQKATDHINYQIKKALKQMGAQDSEVDLSLLSEEQRQIVISAMQEIEKENDERGER